MSARHRFNQLIALVVLLSMVACSSPPHTAAPGAAARVEHTPAPGAAAQAGGVAALGVVEVAFIPLALPVAAVALPFALLVHRSAPSAGQGWLARPVSLDDAYYALYGVRTNWAEVDQQSGHVLRPPVPRTVQYANAAFGSLGDSRRRFDMGYLICAEGQTQEGKSYLLISLVHRMPPKPHMAPSWTHVPDVATDQVIDWVALDADLLNDDKTYALLLAAAANEALADALAARAAKPNAAAEYWQAQQRWRAGDVGYALDLSQARAKRILSTAQQAPIAAPPHPP